MGRWIWWPSVAFIWVVIFPVALALVDGELIAFTIVLWIVRLCTVFRPWSHKAS
jgi:hypothetical protein